MFSREKERIPEQSLRMTKRSPTGWSHEYRFRGIPAGTIVTVNKHALHVPFEYSVQGGDDAEYTLTLRARDTAEGLAIKAKAKEMADQLKCERLEELRVKRQVVVIESAQVDAMISIAGEVEAVAVLEEELRAKRRKVRHGLEKSFVPAGDPEDRVALRSQLKEARKKDVTRACPSGRACRVPCVAPHVVARPKIAKAWMPKIARADVVDDEDDDYTEDEDEE